MFNSTVFFGRSVRQGLGLAAAMFAVSAMTAQGQNSNPQLLPYNLSVVAGGGTTAPAKGATCPVSGLTSTDAYGDGCLATEVLLGAPRFVTSDKNGVVFFADTNNGLIRRIDPSTGVITTVAGGAASSPSTGTACGVGVSTDAHGDGCPATLVKISKPEGLVFDASGNLFFADNSYDDVREVAAIGGAITVNSIITNVAGNISTYGYATNNGSVTPIIAATSSYLNFPYGVAVDAAGNVYVADEGNQALSVINTGAAPRTIQGAVVPAGTIQKLAGYGNLNTKSAAGECPNFTAAATGSRGGCYFGSWTDGSAAAASNLDNPFDIAVDAAGNFYFANYFNYNVGKVSATDVITNYAGIQGTKGTALTRGTAGTFGIGNTFNVALDASANLYISDGTNGVVWRVDGVDKSMAVVVGGATTVCANAVDAVGDGCPATQSILSKLSGSGATLVPGGAGGLNVDIYGNLYVTDTTTSTVREAATGAQSFGNVAPANLAQTLQVHFAPGDGPAASGAYTITAGAIIFTTGATACVANSDNSMDCTLLVIANPTVLGPFTGTLQVKSLLGKTSAFPLSGTYLSSRVTRTIVGVSFGTSCSGSSTVSTTAPVALSATINSTGAPTGTITFFSNNIQVGTPQAVTNIGSTAVPVYGTNYSVTFPTPGTYTITATYSGDTNFNTSTGKAGPTVTTSAPTFTLTVIGNSATGLPSQTCLGTFCAIVAGETALYSFNVAETVYNGSVSFSCAGLPAGANCIFSPTTVADAGCSQSAVVALSITTQQATPIKAGSLMLPGGRGPWSIFLLLPGFGLALLIGLRRRHAGVLRTGLGLFALLLALGGMAACGKGTSSLGGTPSGTYTVTVTAAGSAGGTVSNATVTMVVQ